MKHSPGRQQNKTLLLVGEGGAEEAFLRYLKAAYCPRGCGVAVTIKNAHGKGAGNVIDVAIRAAKGAAFDTKAVLLDTDQDWNDKTRKQAKLNKITVLLSTPCFEATLLSIHQHSIDGCTPEQLKRNFKTAFGSEAHARDVYPKHFGSQRLEVARQRLDLIDTLLRLLRGQ